MKVCNPYLREVVNLEESCGVSVSSYLQGFTQRFDMCKRYSWAIPTQTELDIIATYGPIVDLGAGRGYWAYLLQQMDVNVVAYDSMPPHTHDNKFCCGGEPWFPVEYGDETILTRHSDHTLMLVWPCGNASSALDLYRGNTIIYIGEGRGGCCASDRFFDNLEYGGYKLCKTYPMKRWMGVHDNLHIYGR